MRDSSQILKGPIYEIGDYGDRIIVEEGDKPISNNGEEWEEFEPNTERQSSNGNITVNNTNSENSLWVNFASLKLENINLLDKVRAFLTLFPNNEVKIENVESDISERDISFPIERFVDTRLEKDDVIVYQHNNYGVYITYRLNPLISAKLEWNDQERVETDYQRTRAPL